MPVQQVEQPRSLKCRTDGLIFNTRRQLAQVQQLRAMSPGRENRLRRRRKSTVRPRYGSAAIASRAAGNKANTAAQEGTLSRKASASAPVAMIEKFSKCREPSRRSATAGYETGRFGGFREAAPESEFRRTCWLGIRPATGQIWVRFAKRNWPCFQLVAPQIGFVSFFFDW